MIRALGWLLGIENATAIDRIDVSLAAPWAQENAFWVFTVNVCGKRTNKEGGCVCTSPLKSL